MIQPSTERARVSTFFDYRRTEINLVSDLQRLQILSTKLGLDAAIIELIEQAMVRNKEHRFSIAVVGEFKRGKSTFINALLGKDILPSDILPCSATLNRVVYDLEPAVEIIYKVEQDAPSRVERIKIDELANYVTKLTPEAEQVAATVQEAVIHYPIAYCQNNVEIIDTPGLNDDATMTDVTLSVLPEVSAAILVIMPEAPFSGYEADFLNNELLLKDMGRIIFVVTAIDRVRRPADRERILKVIEDRIQVAVERRLVERFGSIDSPEYQVYRKQIGRPRVFGLSGYQALTAREENDSKLLAESGFPMFETELEKFVTETRGAVELQVLANRIIGAGNEILKKLNMETGALQMGEEEFETTYDAAITQLESLRKRRTEEVRQIADAAQATKQRVRPLVEELAGELTRAAGQAIDATEVKAADLNSPAFIEELGKMVSTTIRVAGKRQGEKIQLEIERDLMNEIQRLGNFAAEVNQVLHNIEIGFSQPGQSEQRGVAGDAMAVVVGGITGSMWGGALAGYQEAGGKGAAVGAAAGFGAIMAGYMALAALSLPFTWPVAIVLGIASTFAGKYVVRFAFASQRIENFKQNYKRQVFEQIDKQLREQRIDIEVFNQVNNVYDALKSKFIGELDASIEQTQNTIDQLRNQRERKEIMAEQKSKEYNELVLEVEKMRSRAQALSNQLIEYTQI